MNTYEEALKIKEEQIKWRRDLHQIPELGLKTPKTVAYITDVLKDLGIDYEVKEDISCVFATIGKGEKCILLRADMDALPVEEKSGEPFAADGGCSHACGHDLHAATLLGVAKILKENEDLLGGTVKLLFQSAEETFEGARAAIDAGVLENPKVDAAFGMHVFAMYETGTLLYNKFPMGAVYGFEITITGKGGHGSQPERCIDPINGAVQVYLALQSLLARELPPTEEAALTIGQFVAGTANNAIPETAVLKGTLRTFKPEIREMLIKRLNEISVDVAKAYRCGCEIKVVSDVPSVMNDDDFMELCLNSVKKTGTMKTFDDTLHLMGSEDFALFGEKVPACYFVAGSGVDDETRWRGQHNPEIVFNEDAMCNDTAIFLQVVEDFFNK